MTASIVCFGGRLLGSSLYFPALIVCALAVPLLFLAFRGSSWDDFIGNLSYPVYLTHLLVAAVLLTVLKIASGPIVAIVSLATAVLLFKGVDFPIDRLRQRLAQRATATGVLPAGDADLVGPNLNNPTAPSP